MKEELTQLFQIIDVEEARSRRLKWFDAAVYSGVPALVKLGRHKLKRLDCLVAHSKFEINTSKLKALTTK